jgi:hypothetical protein
MELALLAFFVLLLVASFLGWTADSRDSADWRSTGGGPRRPTWPAYPD